MKNEINTGKVIHILLRSTFAVCLFLSQFRSTRTTLFTDNNIILISGGILIIWGILFWISASISLHEAIRIKEIAQSGLFRYIRHPIYTSMYILCSGLGLIFFAWLWFVVLVIFIPLWYFECEEEEKQMIKSYGKKYLDYKARTGMFLPKIR